MILPFVKTSGATTDLVKDYDFKNHYPDINMNTTWANVSADARTAIRSYVRPYLGRTLYDDICTKLQASTALTDEQTEFAEMLKDVCAHYTIMQMLPKKKTILASMGAVENVATEGTTASSLWGFKTTLWAVAQASDRMMDELLALLQEFVEENVTYFVTNWKATTAHDSVSSGFFRHTSELQQFHPINRSFRTFKTLVPIMDQCAERYILPVLCQEQYDALLDAVKNNNASTEETSLINKVRKSLAKWTIYEASKALPFLPDQEGFRLISNADAIDQRAFSADSIQTAIMGIQQSAENAARTNTADLIDFLYQNASDYPLWEASDCNKANSQTSLYPIFEAGPGAIML